MSALSTPAASVAGTGAAPGGAPSPSADPDVSLGTQPGGEPGGGAAAEPGAGAAPDGAKPEAGSEADGGVQVTAADEDGRSIPANWRELAKTDPKFRATFFEHRDFKKECPGGLPELREMKSTLEAAGGEAGLQQMQTDLGDFRNLANQFLDGDPAFVADAFETDPVAAVSLVPAFLDKAREVDEPAYNRLIAQRIHAEHAAQGVELRPRLQEIYNIVKAKDPSSPALAILNGIAGWHDRLQKLAESEEDPRIKKLQQQIREGRKSEETTTLKQANEDYLAKGKAAVDKGAGAVLDSYLKGRKIESDDRTSLLNYAIGIADKNISADTAFTKRRDEIAKTRNAPALLKFVSARWEKELGIVIPKRIARLFGLGAPAPKADAAAANGKPAPAASAVPGFTKITEMPNPKKIDWSRTTQDMLTKQHRCFLKGTKDGVYWVLAG